MKVIPGGEACLADALGLRSGPGRSGAHPRLPGFRAVMVDGARGARLGLRRCTLDGAANSAAAGAAAVSAAAAGANPGRDLHGLSPPFPGLVLRTSKVRR